MSEILLDTATHTYTVDGEVKPSVTQVMDILTDFIGVPSAVLERKRAIGIAAHKACELHDAGTLDVDSVHDLVIPYLNAYMKFKRESGIEVIANETLVYNSPHDYCGTVDLIAKINGKKAVIDIKCTAEIYDYVGVQLAAYADAVASHRPDIGMVFERYAVQLKPDGTYRLKKFEDKFEFITFLGCLQVYKWRKKHE